MNIRIRYFASLKEVVERNEESFVVPEGSTLSSLREQVIERYPRLQPILQRCVSAVNRNYTKDDVLLHDGDEVVFIPPMGGGAGKQESMEPIVQLTRDPLRRDVLVEAVSHPGAGGIVVFEGVVRDHARGKQVRYLEYDVYEEMAEQQIRLILDEVRQRWGIERVAVAHRFGRLEIGEASVIIVVASAHRAEAFDACRYIIDTLKTTVPIWKKEVALDGEEWVEG